MDLCEREVSPDVPCKKIATRLLRIRDEGTKQVHICTVCEQHYAEHNRAAASRRTTSK